MGLMVQIKAFLLTMLVGIIAGVILHYYQSTIRNLRLRKYAVIYLLDIILWIIMIIIIAAALLLINQGEIRGYVFIALLAGGAMYYKYISRYLQAGIEFLGNATANLFRAIFGILLKPFVIIIKVLKDQYHRRQIPPVDDDDNDDEK